MLRSLVLVLIFANGLFFAWSQGYLKAYGFAPVAQTEPQRLEQQIRPDAIRVLSTSDFKNVEAQVQADLAPKECLIAGPMDDAVLPALRTALESALPQGAWQFDKVDMPERWILYMGKYANADLLAKKRKELEGLDIKSEVVHNPALEFGLSIGSFDTQAAATAELSKFASKGVRTAKVVKERDAGEGAMLKLPAITEALKSRLGDVKTAMGTKSFHSCN
jgi:hypothetical protein